MNKVDTDPVTDYNYEEKLEKNYETVTNRTFKATVPVKTVIDVDFQKCSNNFWLSHEGGKLFPVFNEGVMSGTYNARQPTFKAITDTFVEALKNILRIQCEQEDKSSEEFGKYIAMLDLTFDLLADKLDSTMDERLDGELMMAYLHATFNAFITTNIKIKE